MLQSAIPLLVGTKYDEFVHLSDADHEEVTRQVTPGKNKVTTKIIRLLNQPQSRHGDTPVP